MTNDYIKRLISKLENLETSIENMDNFSKTAIFGAVILSTYGATRLGIDVYEGTRPTETYHLVLNYSCNNTCDGQIVPESIHLRKGSDNKLLWNAWIEPYRSSNRFFVDDGFEDEELSRLLNQGDLVFQMNGYKKQD